MDLTLQGISIVEVMNVILVMAVLFMIYRYLRTFGVYKIDKPYAWEEAVNSKQVSKELVRIERSYRDKVRFYNLWFQVERLRKNNISGAFAELGVYKGETAKAIHYMDPDRKFYLFDTFEGFMEKDLAGESQSDRRFLTSLFADTDLKKVEDFIGGNDNLQYRPGFFPGTAKGLENESFALVNIDADLYVPTIEALRFFYPRLVEDAVIIVHDYNHNWKGVNKALDEFMPTIPESLFELSDWQGSAMIIKNSRPTRLEFHK